LVVTLSPQAAASHWVNKEVSYWLEHRGRDQLLLVLADGQLQWDGASARFDPQASDAALPVLTEPGVLPAEPLFIDVSEDAPWDFHAPVFREKITYLSRSSCAIVGVLGDPRNADAFQGQRQSRGRARRCPHRDRCRRQHDRIRDDFGTRDPSRCNARNRL
jgi:hypothetical protein